MSANTLVANEQASYCTFSVDNLYCGIEVSLVQEVIRQQTMTQVPLASRLVTGLMNLRGQIVTALNLRTCFSLSSPEGNESQMNVVIRTPDGPVSLLVDKIGDVVQVNNDSFEPPPETLSDNLKELIRGAFKLDDELLLIINTENVIRLMN